MYLRRDQRPVPVGVSDVREAEIMPALNEVEAVEGKRLGKLPAKADTRALHLGDFADFPDVPPESTGDAPTEGFWDDRKDFPLLTFGNDKMGNCTIASECQFSLRAERIEQRRTIVIPESEPIRVYREMSDELYGGGDNGAYEVDALNRWRRQDKTFRDSKGRALTIDAFLRLNAFNHNELRGALAIAGAHGIKVCLNLPLAFQRIDPPEPWDIPEGQPLIGEWLPGSWGGHSMTMRDYILASQVTGGGLLVHTWKIRDQLITWRAMAAYLDEAHLVVDSLNYWKKHKALAYKILKLNRVREAVNDISSVKIARAA